MQCAACRNKMIGKKGEFDLRIMGKLYLVRNVAYEECPVCGEKVLTPEISQALYDRVKKKDFLEEEIRLPVLDGTYG
jgi:YgiT-type zinc finger domain-containing protein